MTPKSQSELPDQNERLIHIYETLSERLSLIRFKQPVACVYNPLVYAREAHQLYLQKYGNGQKEVVFLGMNPGPFGMAQTGVPFGEVNAVKNWLKIEAKVDEPGAAHPKRPILGFDCPRSEVSGRRLWGWAQERFDTPDHFFNRFFVSNYCPLVFMEESGRNRTPDKLAVTEKQALFGACDDALKEVVGLLKPEYVVGVGLFAEQRAKHVLSGMDVKIARIAHPSPANPKANKGWSTLIEKELKEIGIGVD